MQRNKKKSTPVSWKIKITRKRSSPGAILPCFTLSVHSHHPIYLVHPAGVPRLIQGGFPEPGSGLACSSGSPPLPWRTRTRRRDCSEACPETPGLLSKIPDQK